MIAQRFITASAFTILAFAIGAGPAAGLTDKEAAGKGIFFDNNLSLNRNQSCAACHAPEAGWTGPSETINAHGAVYEGSITGRFGNRKPPSSAYATTSPLLHMVIQKGGTFLGGNFWDGRATGEKLGNPAADQAQGPFLNPLEHALTDAACIVYRVCNSADYGWLFKNTWTGACDIAWPLNTDSDCDIENNLIQLDDVNRAKVNKAYDYVGLSIAAYEASPEVNSFSSKYDAVVAGKARFARQEQEGFKIFSGKGKCNKCHTISKKGQMDLLTDYTFDNLGVPRNPENPFYQMTNFNPQGAAWIDPGLGGFLSSRIDYAMFANINFGKHKVPTLRNVDKRLNPMFVKSYAHNGFFKSLKGIVHFYNTRDVKPVCPDSYTESESLAAGCWPLPELALNMNTKELGNLGLSEQEEWALVDFLKTLTDLNLP